MMALRASILSSTLSTSISSSSSIFRLSLATLSSFIASSKKPLSRSLMLSASFTLCSSSNIRSALAHASFILSFLLSLFLVSISSSNSPFLGPTLLIFSISKLASSFSSSTFFSSSFIVASSFEILENSKNASSNSCFISLNFSFFEISSLSSKFRNFSFSNSFASFAERYLMCSRATWAKFFFEMACWFIKYLVLLSFKSLKILTSSFSMPNSSSSNLCSTSASISLASLSFSPKTAIMALISTDLPAPLTPVNTLRPSLKFSSTFLKFR